MERPRITIRSFSAYTRCSLGVNASTMSVLAPGARTRWPHVTDRCSVSSYLRRMCWHAGMHLARLMSPSQPARACAGRPGTSGDSTRLHHAADALDLDVSSAAHALHALPVQIGLSAPNVKADVLRVRVQGAESRSTGCHACLVHKAWPKVDSSGTQLQPGLACSSCAIHRRMRLSAFPMVLLHMCFISVFTGGRSQ